MLLNVRPNHWVCELTVKGVGEQSLRSKSSCKVYYIQRRTSPCVRVHACVVSSTHASSVRGCAPEGPSSPWLCPLVPSVS